LCVMTAMLIIQIFPPIVGAAYMFFARQSIHFDKCACVCVLFGIINA
jgi:hypothetical protein